MSLIAYTEVLTLPPNGDVKLPTSAENVSFDKISTGEIDVAIGSNSFATIKQGRSIEANEPLGEVRLKNTSTTSSVDLELYFTGGGVANSGEVQISGSITTSSGTDGRTHKHSVNTTAKIILNKDLSRNVALLRVLNGTIYLANTEAGATVSDGFPVFKGEAITIDSSAEYWAVSETGTVDLRILEGVS